MVDDTLVNQGFIVRAGTRPDDGTGHTIIVSGVARSGTTMVAGVLREAGLHMGTFLADVVHEDRQLLAILRSGERSLLADAIAERDAAHREWGFKIPNLHAYLTHAELDRFRNPRLVLIFRDAVAVAVRNGISEMFDEFTALAETAAAKLAVIEFARAATCPVLLLSYEKALVFPEMLVEAVSGFCGLQPDAAMRDRMVGLVRPNPEEYIRHARRQFAGSVDLLRNGTLHGWCCEVGELEPVEVDVYLDGTRVATAKADRFRSDLRDAGFGNGNHGFSVGLHGLAERTEAVVHVRVHGRAAEVSRSGLRLAEYAAPGLQVATPQPKPASAGKAPARVGREGRRRAS